MVRFLKIYPSLNFTGDLQILYTFIMLHPLQELPISKNQINESDNESEGQSENNEDENLYGSENVE